MIIFRLFMSLGKQYVERIFKRGLASNNKQIGKVEQLIGIIYFWNEKLTEYKTLANFFFLQCEGAPPYYKQK